MEKKVTKAQFSIVLGVGSKKILEEIVVHMRLKKYQAYNKLVTYLRDPDLQDKFRLFLEEYKDLGNITIDYGYKVTPTSIYLSKEIYDELNIIFWKYGFSNRSQFFKQLIYFYYNTNIGDVEIAYTKSYS